MSRLLVLLIISLLVLPAEAAIHVSPVVIEANDAQSGDEFSIRLYNSGLEPRRLLLQYGRFHQDSSGALMYDDSAEAQLYGKRLLSGLTSELKLEALTGAELVLTLNENDFSTAYPMVLIGTNSGNVSSRMAVLFLLASEPADNRFQIGQPTVAAGEAVMHVRNLGAVHQPFQSQVICVNASGEKLAEISVSSGRILPGAGTYVRFDIPTGTYSITVDGTQVFFIGEASYD